MVTHILSLSILHIYFLFWTGKCICDAVGDPDIIGFDGHHVRFAGHCKYTLVKSTKEFDACAFTVEIENDPKPKHTNMSTSVVSRIKNVYIHIFGLKIQLSRGGTCFVSNFRTVKVCNIEDLENLKADFCLDGKWNKLHTHIQCAKSAVSNNFTENSVLENSQRKFWKKLLDQNYS